ncbi:family 64 glycoside hydrolase [Mariannaea sp. PMI_226]|nr:family 64 glycoside hydrolase [Mariannaea sp. PMI_226]
MRPFLFLASLIGVALCAPSSRTMFPRGSLTSQGFTIAQPGGLDQVEVTANNTLNGTIHDSSKTIARRVTTANLPLKFTNNFSGGAVNAYISGLDSAGSVVFIAADGSLVYPSSGGSSTPVPITQNIAIPISAKGQTVSFTLPIELSSARIYFVEGSLKFYMVKAGNGDGLVQPSVTNLQDASAGLNWGFVEFTYTGRVLYANISYVDFVGMPLGMLLSATDGSKQTAYGLKEGSVANICNDLVAQNSEGYPWSSMCISNSAGKPVRALSPNDYNSINSNAFANYWSSYVNSVWTKYSSETLTINTQTSAGNVACKVSGGILSCNGDNRGYAKPSAADIWGCNSGPFAIQGGDNAIHYAVVPRLCAAFTRSTLLLNGGNVQPSLGQSSYYTVNPTSHYSRIVHKYESDGKGYAFSYDDVNPNGNENASGTVSSGITSSLTIYIGAPPS